MQLFLLGETWPPKKGWTKRVLNTEIPKKKIEYIISLSNRNTQIKHKTTSKGKA